MANFSQQAVRVHVLMKTDFEKKNIKVRSKSHTQMFFTIL